jgi:hypothetical protein
VGRASGLDGRVHRRLAAARLEELLEGGLRVAAAAAGLGELRAELAQQEGARDLEARVQVQRSEHGLERVGQDRVLGAPALLAFAAARRIRPADPASGRGRQRALFPRRPAPG